MWHGARAVAGLWRWPGPWGGAQGRLDVCSPLLISQRDLFAVQVLVRGPVIHQLGSALVPLRNMRARHDVPGIDCRPRGRCWYKLMTPRRVLTFVGLIHSEHALRVACGIRSNVPKRLAVHTPGRKRRLLNCDGDSFGRYRDLIELFEDGGGRCGPDEGLGRLVMRLDVARDGVCGQVRNHDP